MEPPARDPLPTLLTGALFVLLLVTVREVLVPPVVLPFLFFAGWPLRGRPGVRAVLISAVLLTIIWALHRYGSLLGPFLLALAVAYLLAPLVARLERRGVNRGLAIILVCVPPIGAALTLFSLAAPQLWSQAAALVEAFPRFATTVLDALQGLRARIAGLAFLTEEQRTWISGFDAQQVALLLQQNADQILSRVAEWGWAFARRLGTVVGFLGYVVVTPIVAFYLLRDWRPLLEFLEGLIPPGTRTAAVEFIERYDAALGRFVRGQLLEATLVGILTGTGLALLGVPSALLLGVTAGLFNLVPYVGLLISLLPALVVALAMPSPGSGLLRVGIVFAAVQFLDGSVTGPRIVGGSVGLHPVVIMLALAFGGALLGFAGLLLAVPLAVLVKMLGTLAIERYRQSRLYGAGEAAHG